MLAIAVFTNRGRDRLIAEGGTQAWVLNPERARKLTYVVCAQKRNDGDWGQPTHKQGQGFLIGKISSIEPSPEPGCGERFIVRFSAYADIDVPNMAQEWRNPVRYIELGDYGLDPTKLTFASLDQSKTEPPRAAPSSTQPLDMANAKKALSAFYNVPVSSIEITIRG